MWPRTTTRRAALWTAGGLVLALVVLVALAATHHRTLIQSTGVLTVAPIGSLGPGHQACQQPIIPREKASVIGFYPRASPPTPPLVVSVRDLTSDRVVARARIPSGYSGVGLVNARLDRPTPVNRPLAICVRDVGRTAALIMGDDGVIDLCVVFGPASLACRYHLPHPISSTSRAMLDGKPVGGTMFFALQRERAASVLSRVGAATHHASNFRPAFVSPALWWVLLLAVGLGVPAAAIIAVRGLADDEPAQRP